MAGISLPLFFYSHRCWVDEEPMKSIFWPPGEIGPAATTATPFCQATTNSHFNFKFPIQPSAQTERQM
jgi:hypothetical protein